MVNFNSGGSCSIRFPVKDEIVTFPLAQTMRDASSAVGTWSE